MSAFVFSGLIGEALVRTLPRSLVPELNSVQPATLELGGFARLSSNPRLGYELAPGVLEINAAGYRGPRVAKAVRNGTTRIVGIGDSGAFGLGVHDRDTYLRRLENAINSSGHSNVEVVNLAVSGYNTHQELEVLRTRGFEFEPDLVVLGYDHNDPTPMLGQFHPPMPDDYGDNPLGSELVRYVMRKLYAGPILRSRNRVDGYLAKGPDWDRHLQALADICDSCNARGIPVIVVMYDMMVRPGDFSESKHYRALHAPLLELWKQYGVRVIDCYPLFQEHMHTNGWADTQNLWVSVEPRDAHPNEEGHRLIAEALFATIESDSLLQ